MHKLGIQQDGNWVAHFHQAVFETTHRIVAGVPGGDSSVFRKLVECVAPPYYLLYVLHTPRGEAAPGRYQSPSLTLPEVQAFLARFSAFLSADARYDLWAHSPSENATVVWDRHNLLFAYGPLDRYAAALGSMGFTNGQASVSAPHEHYYRGELDPMARELMAAFDWSFSPLRPGDEQ
jgi:hypothetical protein